MTGMRWLIGGAAAAFVAVGAPAATQSTMDADDVDLKELAEAPTANFIQAAKLWNFHARAHTKRSTV